MLQIRQDNQYVSYVLEEQTHFSSTGYRVLKKQKEKGFIVCSKILYNGKVKLLYPIEAYTPMYVAAEEWGITEVCQWILRILQSLMEVGDSGFLRIEDVDMSHIYLDLEQKCVHLIVLPFTSELSMAENHRWEWELEMTLLTLFEVSKIHDGEIKSRIKNIIREQSCSLDNLCNQIKQAAQEMHIPIDTEEMQKKQIETYNNKELHIVLDNAHTHLDISVTKDNFVLGKNPKLSDGVVNLAPTISRQHCRIIHDSNGYYVEDMQSLNHTFVDGVMLQPGKRVLLQHGMKLCLAEIELTAEFR